jgi:translation elongation factor EF-Tu-like GTPase
VNDRINEVIEEDALVFSSLDEFESNFEVLVEKEEKEVISPQIEVNENVNQQTNVNDVIIQSVEANNEDKPLLVEVKDVAKIQQTEVKTIDKIQRIEVKVENEADVDGYDFIVEKYDVKFSKLQSIANDELNSLIEIFKGEYENLSLKEKESISTKALIAAKYVKYAKELESRIDDFFYFMIDGFGDELSAYGYDGGVTYEYIDVYENEKEIRKTEILRKALN